MNVPSLPALLCVIALGQICAIGLHVWAWQLRQDAIWSLAVMGIFATSLFYLTIVVVGGAAVMDVAHPRSQAHRLESITTLAWLLFDATLPPAVGFLHAWQLQGCWRTTRDLMSATLSVFGELTIAALALIILTCLNAVVHLMSNDSGFFFVGTFMSTLLVLMIFRPLVLKFLRPFLPLFKSLSEKLRFLHPKVRGDVS